MKSPVRNFFLSCDMFKFSYLVFWFSMATLLPLTPAPQQQIPLKEENVNTNPFNSNFKKLAEENLKRWNVPGVAVSVVDGEDIWAEGYGFATLPSTPVTPSTLFHGASTTKAFTAAILAILISEKEHKALEKGFKTPISEILREDFVLKDSYRTEHVTLEDALSHRTGMPRHDFSYGGVDEEGKTYGLKDLIRGLRHLELAGGFRERFMYCNMMYATASYAVETLTGKWMGDVLKEKIWEPLGMKSTYFSAETARAGPNHFAQGYVYHKDEFKEVPDQKFEVVSGAGAIISNVLDYAKWLKALLTHTDPLSKEDITALLTPRSFPPDFYDPNPFTGTHTYALGWFRGIYHGYEYYEHSGGMEAFGAEVIFFPKLNYGVVAFGNTGTTSNAVELALRWKLIDDKLNIPAEKRFDWNKLNDDRVKAVREAYKNSTKVTYPNIPSPPLPLSLPLEKYTGTYHHPTYHNITLEFCPPTFAPFITQHLCAKRTNATWKMKLDLKHVSGEFFMVDFEPLEAPSMVSKLYAPAEFRIDAEGKVGRFGVGFEPELGREGLIWFVRVE